MPSSVWLGGGEVVFFLGIVLEIKKFKVVVFVKVDEAPIAIANRGVGRGAAGVVMGIMPIKRTR